MAVDNPWRVLAGVIVGALVHVVNVLVLMVLAAGIQVHVHFFDWCWIAGLTSVAGLIPITIGQITSGGALVALLHLQNVPMVDSLALAALAMAVNGMLAGVGSLLEWNRLRIRLAVPTQSASDETS